MTIIDFPAAYLSDGDIQNRRHGYNTYIPSNDKEMRSYISNKWGINVSTQDLRPVRVKFTERVPATEEVVPASTLVR